MIPTDRLFDFCGVFLFMFRDTDRSTKHGDSCDASHIPQNKYYAQFRHLAALAQNKSCCDQSSMIAFSQKEYCCCSVVVDLIYIRQWMWLLLAAA